MQQQQQVLEQQMTFVSQLLSAHTLIETVPSPGKKPAKPADATVKKQRRMSAAGRKAVSEASKRRWAAFRKAKTKSAKKAKKSATAVKAKKVVIKKVARKAPPKPPAVKKQTENTPVAETATTVTT